MKNREELLHQTFENLPVHDLEIYLELGEKARMNGDINKSVYWFKNGFEMAKQLKDRSRVQQFSNILFSIL